MVVSHSLQALSLRVQAHVAGAVEFVFEFCTNGAKRFEFAPTNFDGAGAGDSVTLALDVQAVLGRLKKYRKKML